MLAISLKDLKLKFNAKPIMDASARAKRKTLNGFGAYVRSTSRNSIKTRQDRNEHAPPGGPPYGHSGKTRYKDWIFYVVEGDNVVIGAVLLPRRDSVKMPGVVEQGGQTITPSGRRVAQAARPHMRPAFEKAKKQLLPRLIANSIVKG